MTSSKPKARGPRTDARRRPPDRRPPRGPEPTSPRNPVLDQKTIYRSERAHVLCGDSLEVLPLLPAESVDLMVTDPPYGVRWQSGQRREAFPQMAGDDDASFVGDALRHGLRVLRRNRHCYVFGPLPPGLPLGGTTEIIWDKVRFGPGDLANRWGPQHEHITFATYAPGRPRTGALAARLRRGSVISVPRLSGPQVQRHPTEKPLDLIRQLVESSSNLGEVVLDPFAGSGTTGAAAIVAGRKALLIEVDPRYAAIAAERAQAAEAVAAQIEGL